MNVTPAMHEIIETCYNKIHAANDMIEKLLSVAESDQEIEPADVNRFTEQMRTANAFAHTLQLHVQGVKPPKTGDEQ